MNTLANLRYETIEGKSVLVKSEPPTPVETSVPQLAVVVLAFGAPSTAVETVRSLKNQHLAVEIVVVNSGGGGMDRIFAAHDVDVPLLDNGEFLNLGQAKNLGIRATTAPLIAFIAADNIVAADWSHRVVFVHQSGVAAAGSSLENSSPYSPIAWAAHFASWPRSVAASLRGGVSYERRLFDTYGLFREDLALGEDKEFHARLPSQLPDRNVKIRAARPNPTRLSQLISQQYRRGAQAARIDGNRTESACSFGAWRFPLERAWRACLKGKKDRAVVILALPLIPIAMLAYCLGTALGRVRESRN